MANIGTVKIPFDNEYHDVAEMLSTTLTNGKMYTVQVEGDLRLCETVSKPSLGGIRVTWLEPFEFEYDGRNKLWVKCLSSIKDSYITLAD